MLKQQGKQGDATDKPRREIFGEKELYDANGQFACPIRPHGFWKGGRIKLIEINHSDIFWLGSPASFVVPNWVVAIGFGFGGGVAIPLEALSTTGFAGSFPRFSGVLVTTKSWEIPSIWRRRQGRSLEPGPQGGCDFKPQIILLV